MVPTFLGDSNMLKKILVLVLTLAMLIPSCVFADEIDIQNMDASEWMKYIPNDAYINALNIPGTHDSGLHIAKLGFGKFSQCQTLTIAEQLEIGVRFFDIRLRFADDPGDRNDDDFIFEDYICHGQGIFCCDGYKTDGNNYTYTDVLTEMADFIEAHPSEAIFFFVRNEDYDEDEQMVDAYYNMALQADEQALRDRFAAKGQDDVFNIINGAKVPTGTMESYRGKITRFGNGKGFGDIMDGKYNDYDVSYADKWQVIKPFLDQVEAQDMFTSKPSVTKGFRAAYTSCTGQYTYNSSGEKVWNNVGIIEQFPTGGDEAKEMNKLLMKYDFIDGAYYGWIAMDMVTSELARKIFRTNDFNGKGMQVPEAVPTYIKDIAGFCDFSYDDALQDCYAAGYTPLPVSTLSNGMPVYDVNTEGCPIVLGYTTTTNPDGAITNIVGRYDSNIPGGYEKVLVYGSAYNYFTRLSDFSSEDTYLFVTRRNGAPINELKILHDQSGRRMATLDLDGDIPVGSSTIFNLQEGVEDDDDNDIFIGIEMISIQKPAIGSLICEKNLMIIAGVIIIGLTVALMIEVKKNKKLKKQ